MSSSRLGARVAVFLGALAVLAIPAGVVASRLLTTVKLLQALYVTAPAALGLGLLAALMARRARLRHARSVFQPRGGAVRLGRILAWTGIYLGVSGAIALAVYGVLRSAR
jgi:hypothetical protein